MPLAPRTPVLVGVGAVQQREDDPDRAAEPLALMVAALERAAADAGSRALLARADSVRVPRGFWDYADPGRLIAARVGAGAVRTWLAEVGVLQTTLLGQAAADIAAGTADVVLIAGGEARYRAAQAMRAGREAPLTAQAGAVPDVLLRPADEILSAAELQAGLAMPVGQYAMIENALRAASGRTLEAHAAAVASLGAAMSRVAATNPDAWRREPLDAEAIRGARMLAFPYGRLHTSQWTVDQAAGLVLCSAATAQALGIARDRWVFPLAVADANHMLPLTARPALHRSPGFAAAGARVLERLGCGVADLRHLELYSCFPSAVEVQARELGIGLDRQLTVSGGMAFAGGPFNSFVLQALVAMARVLRADPGSVGLVTAVSGIVTKQGVSAWSSEPPARGFCFDDVTAEAAAGLQAVAVVPRASGDATVVSWTVFYEGDAPARAVALCDLGDGRRTIATSADRDLAAAMTQDEFVGRRVRLDGEGAFALRA